MCVKIVERYGSCRCVYYAHALDACPAYGRRGHSIKTQDVIVGFVCSRHWPHKDKGANHFQTSEYSQAGNLLDTEEDRMEEAVDLSNKSKNPQAGDALDRQEDRAEKAIDLSAGFVDEAIDLSEKSENPQAGNTLDGQEDCVEESTIEAPTDSLLRGRLLARFQKIPHTHEHFIPAGDLKEILTDSAIEKELEDHELGDLSSHVLQHAKKTFAILLLIGSLDLLQHLVVKGFEDELLPLAESALVSPNDAELHSAFSKWNLDTRKKFFDSQWILSAPVFSEGQHLKLDDDVRLPFVEAEHIAKGIQLVKIHGDHETFQGTGLTTSQNTRQNGHAYALKHFARGTANADQRAFDRELAVLRSLRSPSHDHIIKYLATFEQRGRYSMILPLADEDLCQFWRRESPSSITSLWLLQQMNGIAAALSYLHNHLSTKDSRPMKGYHMDLKPANILIMKDSSPSGRSWKISDFGNSYLLPKESRQELPPHPGFGTYEPPECQLELPQSQAYDIWSLGCIFIEALAWFIKGSGAIGTFANDRLNDVEMCSNNFKDDCFFTLEFNESFIPLKAMTRLAVIQWIRDLERDPKSKGAIFQLLQLIDKGLLQVDQSKRLKASDLSRNLERIRETSKDHLESGSQLIHRKISEAQVTELED